MSAGHFRIAAIPAAVLLAAAGLHVLPARAQSVPAQSFDGTYTGQAQRVAGTDESCGTGTAVTLVVRDGQFRQTWRPLQDFVVRIGSDGRFHAKTGNLASQADKHMIATPMMEGQVSGNSLVADFGTRFCHYRLEAIRS